MNYDEWEKLHKRGKKLAKKTKKWITKYYGPKCPDTAPACQCCAIWNMYEFLFSEVIKDSKELE